VDGESQRFASRSLGAGADPKGLPVIAKWEQAFSTDGAKTWETNWYNEFIHDDNCTPTP